MNYSILIIAAVAIAGFYLLRILRGGGKAPASKVAEKLKAGAMVIDVRTPQEYRGGAYPGARNVPVDDLSDSLGKLGPKDGPIVVYCASGARSSRAAGILKAAGFLDVTNAGGLAAMPR
jgi:phage shock protein E